jgi:hypothetical protein
MGNLPLQFMIGELANEHIFFYRFSLFPLRTKTNSMYIIGAPKEEVLT